MPLSLEEHSAQFRPYAQLEQYAAQAEEVEGRAVRGLADAEGGGVPVQNGFELRLGGFCRFEGVVSSGVNVAGEIGRVGLGAGDWGNVDPGRIRCSLGGFLCAGTRMCGARRFCEEMARDRRSFGDGRRDPFRMRSRSVCI